MSGLNDVKYLLAEFILTTNMLNLRTLNSALKKWLKRLKKELEKIIIPLI